MKTPGSTIGRQREFVVVRQFLEGIEQDGAVTATFGPAPELELAAVAVGPVHDDEHCHSALGDQSGRQARRLVTAAWMESCRRGHLEQARTLLAAACRLQPCIGRGGWAAATRAFILVNEGGDLTVALRLLDDAMAIESLGGGDRHALAAAGDLASELADLAGRGEPLADQAPIEAFGTPLPSATDAPPALWAASGRPGDELWECRESLFDVVHAGRRHGVTVATVRAAALLSLDSYLAGRWDHVVETADEWITWCDEVGVGSLAWPFHHHRALVAAALGDSTMVEESSLTLIRWASPRGARQLIGYGLHALGHDALAHGDFEEAYRQACGVRVGFGRSAGTTAVHSVVLDLVDAAVHTGRDPRLAAHLASSAAAATRSPRIGMLAAGAAAMCAADDAAEEAFEAALAWPGASRWPFDAARIRLFFGEHLRRNREARRSRDHLAAAADAFQMLGAQPWLHRATAELRATGITRRHQSTHGSPSLTEQERTVVLLAAQGLTNKQIGAQLSLSSRTISAHLYRVFPKLGVTSRGALRAAVDLMD